MRQLITNDIFAASRILKKLGIKPDEISLPDNGKSDEAFGLGLIIKLAENAHLAQTEINDFVGGLVGMTGEEFGKLGIKETMGYFKELKELDGIADFFKLVGQSTK